MLKRLQYLLNPNPVCSVEYESALTENDFRYYDKDGFELTVAERLYYCRNKQPINIYLNHNCYQEEWFKWEGDDSFYLDHSAILHRCSFEGDAVTSLRERAQTHVAANWLIQSKQKWGFDFAMEGIDQSTGELIEILHIEHDSHDFLKFVDVLQKFEDTVMGMDWENARNVIAKHRDEWQHLRGYQQNDWKAKFLIGWEKAETTEKAI